MHIDSLRTRGRAAQGVRLITLKNNAEIAAIARVPRSEDEDEDEIMEAAIDGEVLEDIIEDDTTEDDIIEEDLPEEENGTELENDDEE